MHLSAEQLTAVRDGKPLRFTDPETGGEYVVLTADVYDRVRALLDRDADFDPREAYPLIDEAFREGWDDPKMAEYDRYEEHKR